MSERVITKPSGWKGAKTDRTWTKESKYGVRYMCSTCGKDALGSGGVAHYSTCPIRIDRELGVAMAEAVRTETAKNESDAWRAKHLDDFFRAVLACTDVQTLRALAHRLGYKDGM